MPGHLLFSMLCKDMRTETQSLCLITNLSNCGGKCLPHRILRRVRKWAPDFMFSQGHSRSRPQSWVAWADSNIINHGTAQTSLTYYRFPVEFMLADLFFMLCIGDWTRGLAPALLSTALTELPPQAQQNVPKPNCNAAAPSQDPKSSSPFAESCFRAGDWNQWHIIKTI